MNTGAGRAGRDQPARRARAVVRGRVQGVYFRDTCRSEARALGVSGWVRNRRDGAVEAVFEGTPDAVAAMLAWCHDGPAGAAVAGVEVIDEPPQGEAGFDVRF